MSPYSFQPSHSKSFFSGPDHTSREDEARYPVAQFRDGLALLGGLPRHERLARHSWSQRSGLQLFIDPTYERSVTVQLNFQYQSALGYAAMPDWGRKSYSVILLYAEGSEVVRPPLRGAPRMRKS